jgi:hypothetical protein
VDPYVLLGQLLTEIRQNLQDLHPRIRALVEREGMVRWLNRSEAGWTHRELSELSHFLMQLEDRPLEILEAFSTTFLWRLENGIPCNRKLMATYCYILGFRVNFVLMPVEDNEQEERATHAIQ